MTDKNNGDKKKILIIAGYFAPDNMIAAIRPTKFSKYLHLNHNSEVTVVCMKNKNRIKDLILQNDLQYIDSIHCFNPLKYSFFLSCLYKVIWFIRGCSLYAVKKLSFSKKKSPLEQIIDKSLYFLMFYLSYRIDYNYSKYVVKNILKSDLTEYCAIFSTYAPWSSHYIACKIKEKYPSIKWIADFRDSVWSDTYPKKAISLCSDYVDFVEKKSDYITAASEGVIESLNLKKSTNYSVLYNGFDDMDITRLSPNKQSILQFIYCGLIYKGKRDLSMFFRALEELSDEKKIDKKKFSILYMGPCSNLFEEQIRSFPFPNVYDLKMCTREISLTKQLESDVLLLASWNKKNSTGIITGKFFEYLMMSKPIICTITGDQPNSKLKEMICEANVGFCIEEINSKQELPMLKQYILKLYNEYYHSGITFTPKIEYINQFNYKNNTIILNEIINTLINQ